MGKKQSISAVANTIKTLHIVKDMHIICKQDFYNNKDTEIDDLFLKYLVTIINDIDHPALIE